MQMPSTRKKLIVLDRDGVINEDSTDYIKDENEWHSIPGSLEAIGRLCSAGFRVVVATNQSGIGRGYLDMDALNRIHCKMRRETMRCGGQIEAVFFCPHAPSANCRCRKPQPGLFEQIASRCNLSMKSIPVIGDALRDIQAALAVGAYPILVLTGKGKQTLKDNRAALTGIPIYSDLASASVALIELSRLSRHDNH